MLFSLLQSNQLCVIVICPKSLFYVEDEVIKTGFTALLIFNKKFGRVCNLFIKHTQNIAKIILGVK